MKIIELINISKQYRKMKVLNQINYSFEEGKTYLLIGENGCGKTTLIKAILDLIKVDGEIQSKNVKFSYIPERFVFPEFVNCYDFLYNLGLIKGMRADELMQIVNFYLDSWKVPKQKLLRELSKGMCQKILIIQAILGSPDVFIFDEPLNGLDPLFQKEFLKLIKSFKKNKKTCLITTHYPKYYQKIYDVLLGIENGELIEKSN